MPIRRAVIAFRLWSQGMNVPPIPGLPIEIFSVNPDNWREGVWEHVRSRCPKDRTWWRNYLHLNRTAVSDPQKPINLQLVWGEACSCGNRSESLPRCECEEYCAYCHTCSTCNCCSYNCDCEECPSCRSQVLAGETCACQTRSECGEEYDNCTCTECLACGRTSSSHPLCYRCEEEPILPYSTPVHEILNWGKKPSDGIWLGAELEFYETPVPEDDAWKWNTSYSLPCRDSSVAGGFEVKTVPMGLEDHRKFWKDQLKPAITAGYIVRRAHSGLHVHVDRKAISPLQLGKLLIAANSFGMSLYKFAGRGPADVADWAEYKEKTWRDVSRLPSSRYQAINVTPPATIEFRMFAASTRFHRVMRRIELVHALVRWTKAVSCKDLTWASLKRFIQRPENRKSYIEANIYFNEEGQ